MLSIGSSASFHSASFTGPHLALDTGALTHSIILREHPVTLYTSTAYRVPSGTLFTASPFPLNAVHGSAESSTFCHTHGGEGREREREREINKRCIDATWDAGGELEEKPITTIC